MRKPQIGDEWQLNWLPGKPIRRIEIFSRLWPKWNKWVMGVWFEPTGKKGIKKCRVRDLLALGVLVKPANTGLHGGWACTCAPDAIGHSYDCPAGGNPLYSQPRR